MQDSTRAGVFAGVLAGVAALLAINPSWCARTHTGIHAVTVQHSMMG